MHASRQRVQRNAELCNYDCIIPSRRSRPDRPTRSTFHDDIYIDVVLEIALLGLFKKHKTSLRMRRRTTTTTTMNSQETPQAASTALRRSHLQAYSLFYR